VCKKPTCLTDLSKGIWFLFFLRKGHKKNMAGDEIGTGDKTGDDPFVDGLGVGETYAAGGLAGDLAGESDGDLAGGEIDEDLAGGVDTGGETVGADVGGEVVGEFEVGVGVVAGEMAGEEFGEVGGGGEKLTVKKC
jgi:hypothetical protein